MPLPRQSSQPDARIDLHTAQVNRYNMSLSPICWQRQKSYATTTAVMRTLLKLSNTERTHSGECTEKHCRSRLITEHGFGVARAKAVKINFKLLQ